jgi:hypothetical protein
MFQLIHTIQQRFHLLIVEYLFFLIILNPALPVIYVTSSTLCQDLRIRKFIKPN